MAWNRGFNFRQSSGYVTDGTDETYVLQGDTYPMTRGSVTFGWMDGLTPDGVADRDTTYPKLAGINYHSYTGGTVMRLRIDLPNAGNFAVRLALGDYYNSTYCGQIKIYDNSSLLFTSTDRATATGFVDATDVDRTSASDWITNNAAQTLAFASTICKVEMTSALASYIVIAHFSLSEVTGGGGGNPWYYYAQQ